MTVSTFPNQKLLVANRGEIAVRILNTARRLGLETVAIYTPTDAVSPHVLLANQSISLIEGHASNIDASDESSAYLDAARIVDICIQHGVTLVHPGYGFLSENASFASLLSASNITFLGPRPEIISAMGLKHSARELARKAGVPVVPGLRLKTASSDVSEVLEDIDDTLLENIEKEIGWPVMLKATAGGGGMGIVVCRDELELQAKFAPTRQRAQTLFKDDRLYIERYVPFARHIEIQVFGNGKGHVIHMGERECSVQRRRQKVIEEAPSPFLHDRPELREAMCMAAVRLCQSIEYASAGTCEFLVDDNTGAFYFLEMNTRLQVEHPVTEAIHSGLDIVELMIRQGIAERTHVPIDSSRAGLDAKELDQASYVTPHGHAIEARVYCENPGLEFKPCPGVLQQVEWMKESWVRVDTWVESGTAIPSFFDPLAAKLIVTGSSREEAVFRMSTALAQSKVYGPPNNISYLQAIVSSDIFHRGKALTSFLDGFDFVPRAMEVLAGGLSTTIQDYPGRLMGLGVPRSGPMDSLAFRAANALVGNPLNVECLEMTLTGGTLRFHVSAVIALTGAPNTHVTLDGKAVSLWSRIVIPAGGKVVVRRIGPAGFRAYLAIRGGFPEIPVYLESKSTSMGLGGYQGRALVSGDQLALGESCGPLNGESGYTLPASMIPTYPDRDWTVYCLSGPHDDDEFITRSGIDAFYSTRWTVSSSSNRMGIRLEGPKPEWARKNGGEGGSHPSNIHDNGYALGAVNLNGDTPVILTNEGPDMGGYLCVCTVASAELWKVGQLHPGCTVLFQRVTFAEAVELERRNLTWLDEVQTCVTRSSLEGEAFSLFFAKESTAGPRLHVIPAMDKRPKVVFRQAGDCGILIEYGELRLDLNLRARIHAFESQVARLNIPGIRNFGPCIRSTMCRFNPSVISQSDLLATLVQVEESLPHSVSDMKFPGRRITFPIVLDDQWNKEALGNYMRTVRDKAVYLPSNIEYLAKNNGLGGGEREALNLLISTDWLVLGVGFYLACPFLVPIDPRCRLVGQKMNPSRTFTPRGAIGIAGLVAAIYPVESPGGYQLFGRTLPAWQTWGKGTDFDAKRPWLLQPFDQIKFEPVDEEHYLKLEKQFDAGQYSFKIEPTELSMEQYNAFLATVEDEVQLFKARQAEGVAREEARESELLLEWERSKAKQTSSHASAVTSAEYADDTPTVVSSLSASIWKIRCKVGDVIHSPEDVVVVLEAMKTEVAIEAGEELIGRKVKGFGEGVREGATVRAGQVLVIFED